MSRSVFSLIVAASITFLTLGACSKKSTGGAAGPAASASAGDHADEAPHGDLPTRVRIDPAVIAGAGIETSVVVREPLAATLDLPGELASDPDRTARVSPLVEGRIDAVRFKEGDAVKKGDALVDVRVPELGKAKASYAATSAKAAAARANADRLAALAEKRLAGSQEVATANAEADALEAEAKAAEEQLHALGTAAGGNVGALLTLRAPVDGVVVSRDAIVGQPVTADQTLATIADLREVWFLGKAFEKNLGQIAVGAPAEVTLNAYPNARFAGTIEYLGKQVDPTARTVTARIRLTNRDDMLRIGLFGVARVVTGEAAKAAPVLVVPRSAVTDIAGKPSVFVKEPDGDFERHEVVLGESAPGKVAVASGLREGEIVVSKGVFTLKSAVLKNTFGEEE